MSETISTPERPIWRVGPAEEGQDLFGLELLGQARAIRCKSAKTFLRYLFSESARSAVAYEADTTRGTVLITIHGPLCDDQETHSARYKLSRDELAVLVPESQRRELRDRDQRVPKVLCSRARLIPGVLLPIGPRECTKASGPMLVMLR